VEREVVEDDRLLAVDVERDDAGLLIDEEVGLLYCPVFAADVRGLDGGVVPGRESIAVVYM